MSKKTLIVSSEAHDRLKKIAESKGLKLYHAANKAIEKYVEEEEENSSQ